jgi:hypothetical protein
VFIQQRGLETECYFREPKKCSSFYLLLSWHDRQRTKNREQSADRTYFKKHLFCQKFPFDVLSSALIKNNLRDKFFEQFWQLECRKEGESCKAFTYSAPPKYCTLPGPPGIRFVCYVVLWHDAQTRRQQTMSEREKWVYWLFYVPQDTRISVPRPNHLCIEPDPASYSLTTVACGRKNKSARARIRYFPLCSLKSESILFVNGQWVSKTRRNHTPSRKVSTGLTLSVL